MLEEDCGNGEEVAGGKGVLYPLSVASDLMELPRPGISELHLPPRVGNVRN